MKKKFELECFQIEIKHSFSSNKADFCFINMKRDILIESFKKQADLDLTRS